MNYKKESENADKNFMKGLVGGSLTPNSGATIFDKGDGKTKILFMEGKSNMKSVQSVSINRADILKARNQAFSMGKEFWCLRVDFGPRTQSDSRMEIVTTEGWMFQKLYNDRSSLERALRDVMASPDLSPLALSIIEKALKSL